MSKTNMDPDLAPPKINPHTWPLATLAAVFFTLFAGVVHVVSQATLSFDEYTTQIVGLWTALSVGRGLAVRDRSSESLHPFDRFLLTFPWTWAILVFIAVIGYIGTLGDSLTFNDLGTKLAVLGGAFGLGRGIAGFKRDVTTDKDGAQDLLDEQMALIDDDPDTFPDGGSIKDPNPTQGLGGAPTGPVAPHDDEIELNSDYGVQDTEDSAVEDETYDKKLDLDIAEGEKADPTKIDLDLETDDDPEPVDNTDALEDVSYGDDPDQPHPEQETLEGTESPTSRYTPDPDTLP